MRTVKEELHDGYIELKRLTAAMNGRDDADGPATVEAGRPYSISFTLALLNYCFGNASEAATLRTIQVEDAAALAKLQARLSQSEASASAT